MHAYLSTGRKLDRIRLGICVFEFTEQQQSTHTHTKKKVSIYIGWNTIFVSNTFRNDKELRPKIDGHQMRNLRKDICRVRRKWKTKTYLSSLCGCKDIKASQIQTGETMTSKSEPYFLFTMGRITMKRRARMKQKLKLLNPFFR